MQLVALASLGLVAAIPLMHVALETSRIVVRGDLVYGAEVSGGQGVIDGLGELYDWSHEVLPLAARLVMIAALGLTVLVAVLRRRVDVVAVGALASAALSLVLTAQSGTVATRYYMPAFALCAIALVLGIAGLPRPAPVLALAAIALFEGAAVLAVRDTGTGIPAAELPNLFNRFHRVEGARGRTQEGTGIGLALVLELARLHGGTVGVDSVDGAGSTFTVVLPVRPQLREAAPGAETPTAGEG